MMTARNAVKTTGDQPVRRSTFLHPGGGQHKLDTENVHGESTHRSWFREFKLFAWKRPVLLLTDLGRQRRRLSVLLNWGITRWVACWGELAETPPRRLRIPMSSFLCALSTPLKRIIGLTSAAPPSPSSFTFRFLSSASRSCLCFSAFLLILAGGFALNFW